MRVLVALFLTVAVGAGSTPSVSYAGGDCDRCCSAKLGVQPRPKHRLCDCAPPPPDAPILDTVAIRRVSLPQETRFRIEQTAGDLSAATSTTCGSDKASELFKTLQDDTRLKEFAARLDRMDQQLHRLLELMQAQQQLVDELSRRATER